VPECWTVNASPLIILSRIGRLDFLENLADTVLIPDAVIAEVGAGLNRDPSPSLVIDLPKSFVSHRVEVLVITLDEPEPISSRQKRKPPPQFAGKIKEIGDVITSAPPSDWGME
jgi:hypothetical protein